jgi:hypothetical protein
LASTSPASPSTPVGAFLLQAQLIKNVVFHTPPPLPDSQLKFISDIPGLEAVRLIVRPFVEHFRLGLTIIEIKIEAAAELAAAQVYRYQTA